MRPKNTQSVGLRVHATLGEELALMVEAGATPAQALGFGTSAAAELLGLGDALGSLEPGKNADLTVVSGDPLDEIGTLEEVRLVPRDGVRAFSRP